MDHLAEIQELPHVATLVDAYRKVSAQTKPDTKGWVPRICEIDGLSGEEISAAHGSAIAADLIEIRVEDATHGLLYRPRKAA